MKPTRRILASLLACACLCARGEIFYWTGEGAADQTTGEFKFTDTDNWRLGSMTGAHPTRAPGMTWAGGAQTQAKATAAWATFDAYPNDVIIFSEGSGDETIVDLTGHVCVSNIVFTGNNPVYTFRNYPLAVSQFGTFEVRADARNLPILEAGLGAGTGVSKSSNYVVHIINDKAGTQLDMTRYGRPSARDYINDVHYGTDYFEGAGGFRFGYLDTTMVVDNYYNPASPVNSLVVHRSMHWNQGGKVTFYKSTTSGTTYIFSWIDSLYFSGAAETNEVEFLTGAQLYTSGTGVIRCQANTVFSGDGTLYYVGDMTSSWLWKTANTIITKAGTTADIRCRLGIYENGSQYIKTMRFKQRLETGYEGGVVDLSQVVANDPSAGVFLHFPMTVRVSAIDGTASGTKKAFGATAPIALAGESILAYAGPGETTTRSVVITNLPANGDAAYSATTWTEATLAATLSQRGTGKWIVSGFSNQSRNSSDATLTLDNDTACDAEMASAIGNNPAGTHVTDIVKTGSGVWILSKANTTSGCLTIQEGEIEETLSGSVTGSTGNMTYDFWPGALLRLSGSGAWRELNLITARNGFSTVVLGAGTTTQLNATPLSVNGGRVNFVTQGDGVLTYPKAAGSLLPTHITLNGQTARVDSDGTVIPVGSSIVPTSSIPAKGGVITNGEAIVGITYEGTTGPITQNKTETTVGMLTQMSITPATVTIRDGETLTLGTLGIEKNGAALTVGAEGTGQLAVPSGQSLMIRNESSFDLTVTAPFKQADGFQINKIGTGSVTLPEAGSWSSYFYLLAGSLSLGALDFSSPSEKEAFVYSSSGTTETLKPHGNATTHVAGSTGDGRLLAIDVPEGEMTVGGPGHIETMSVTVGGDGDAKLVVKDGADVFFPQTNGVFRLGKTTGTYSTGVAEMVIENATVGTLLNPGKLPHDFEKFADRQDRAVIVGGACGDGLLRIRDGALVTNRLAMGGSHHKATFLMDGGEFVSLGSDANSGGNRYTHMGYSDSSYWNDNMSYFEQTGGRFINYNSLQVTMGGGNTVYVMTGGNFWMGRHPQSASGSDYLTIQPSTGHVTMYIGGDAFWDGTSPVNMTDQGPGSFTVTVDGNATMRLLAPNQFCENVTRPMNHANIFNVNGHGQIHTGGWRFRTGNDAKVYDEAGNRIYAPDYLNLNGGKIIQPVDQIRDFLNRSNGHQPFNRVTIYENGGAFVLSNGWMQISGALTNATGKGIWSIPFEEPLVCGRTPPFIEIEGDGVAASAMALYDSKTQTMTNILVTAHGVDYTWAQAKLYDGTTLLKTIDCELQDNSTGTLTFYSIPSQTFIMYYADTPVPRLVFSNLTAYVNKDYAISPQTEITINKAGLTFDNSGSVWRQCAPLCIRCECGGGNMRGNRPEGGYTTQGFPVRGSVGINWNWQTNYVIGTTPVDCAYLVSNKIAGVTTVIADQYTKGLQFTDTATIEFVNTSALRAEDEYYTVMRYEPTGAGVPTDFYGMPKVKGKLPLGWYMHKVGNEIQLSIRRGLTAIIW